MKEEIKSKLKKYGKRASLGLALVSLFLLGVGVGACSARKAVGSSAEDTPTSEREQFNLLRYATLIDGMLNLHSDGGSNNLLNVGSTYRTYVFPSAYLPADCTFLVSYDGESLQSEFDSSWYDNTLSGITDGLFSIMEAHDQYEGYPDSQAKWVSPLGGSFASPFLFSLPADFYSGGISRVSFSLPFYVESVYLVEGDSVLRMPSLVDITLPTDFNPIWLYGDAYKGAVYGLLSVNAEGMSYTASLDLQFVSNGSLYDGVFFEFDHLANTWYQEPTSGQIVLADRNANNYHYPVGMYYRRFGQTYTIPSANPDAFDCVWSPQWGLTNDSDGNTHKYLTPIGAFASDAFRLIEVKFFSSVTPVSARWPNLDALALLQLKASGFIISGDTNLYDAFELLGGAFRSVSDILNIQILPFMTLGMLFFIPLIVLVLFAIIRILNK